MLHIFTHVTDAKPARLSTGKSSLELSTHFSTPKHQHQRTHGLPSIFVAAPAYGSSSFPNVLHIRDRPNTHGPSLLPPLPPCAKGESRLTFLFTHGPSFLALRGHCFTVSLRSTTCHSLPELYSPRLLSRSLLRRPVTIRTRQLLPGMSHAAATEMRRRVVLQRLSARIMDSVLEEAFCRDHHVPMRRGSPPGVPRCVGTVCIPSITFPYRC